ncbi:hypothetical protein SAMN05428949_6553 [Chitinophaga sp. YR627]|uniref:hypothetical protein n=1 Tax=Chitinophaga sp. YR627 TaxID=1881041 RepID=UPI0008F08A19|nr:hypothetical protein [Chitinophaga sp. YR627]SFO76683.1 hypothetical protein SAMN05428949_6553 [Chitinophaga sp. YR627]
MSTYQDRAGDLRTSLSTLIEHSENLPGLKKLSQQAMEDYQVQLINAQKSNLVTTDVFNELHRLNEKAENAKSSIKNAEDKIEDAKKKLQEILSPLPDVSVAVELADRYTVWLHADNHEIGYKKN